MFLHSPNEHDVNNAVCITECITRSCGFVQHAHQDAIHGGVISCESSLSQSVAVQPLNLQSEGCYLPNLFEGLFARARSLHIHKSSNHLVVDCSKALYLGG